MTTTRLEIPTIITSDHPSDNRRAVLETLRVAQVALGENNLGHRERLGRLIDDLHAQIEKEGVNREHISEPAVPAVPEADSSRQLASFIVEGWLPPREIADDVLRLIAKRAAL